MNNCRDTPALQFVEEKKSRSHKNLIVDVDSNLVLFLHLYCMFL